MEPGHKVLLFNQSFVSLCFTLLFSLGADLLPYLGVYPFILPAIVCIQAPISQGTRSSVWCPPSCLGLSHSSHYFTAGLQSSSSEMHWFLVSLSVKFIVGGGGWCEDGAQLPSERGFLRTGCSQERHCRRVIYTPLENKKRGEGVCGREGKGSLDWREAVE